MTSQDLVRCELCNELPPHKHGALKRDTAKASLGCYGPTSGRVLLNYYDTVTFLSFSGTCSLVGISILEV